MANIIQQLEDLKEWGQDPERYARRLEFRHRSGAPAMEGMMVPQEFDELSPREEEYYKQEPFSTHEDFLGAKGGVAQLVQPGPEGVRQGYADKSHGKKFTKTELNKAAQHMYGKDYDELTLKTGKKKVYDVIDAQYKITGEKKFKVKTQSKPFSATDQAKIKKAFPDAKFTARNTYGFAPDHPSYTKAWLFVDRGFKLPGHVLPKSVQNEIMEAFPEVKNWNWERGASKYGISSKNEALYKRIESFVNDPKPFRYKFRWGEADGFMLQSMDRAFLQGNENYIPIKEKGKIVGFIDNSKSGKGKKYYHNGYTAAGKKLPEGALLAKNHADYKALSKYVSVAKNSGASLDETSKVFRNLFPEGMDTSKIVFDDLVGFLSKEKGAKNVRKGIVKHHGSYVKTSPTKDLQILTSQLNYEAEKIGKLIKKGDLSRVDDLKKLGIRLVVDGKSYGVGKESAEKGFERIIKSSVSDVKKWGPTEFNKFRKFTKQNPRLAKQAAIRFNSGIPIDEIMKMPGMKKAMPWIKGEGYFALADMLNNWSKGQSFLKGAGKGVEMATFGLVDFDTDEKALLMHALKKGVPENQIKAMMDFLKYKKEEKKLTGLDTSLAALDYHESIGGELGPAHMMNPEEGWNYGDREMLNKRIAKSEKNLDNLYNAYYAGENRDPTLGMVTLENMMESLTAEEWNKTAGIPLVDRGYREMIGAKADEGMVWGPLFGGGMREILEGLGFGETDSLKSFKPQELMSAHPVYGYKEQIKDMESRGISPMEDIRMDLGYALPPQNYAGGGIANVRRPNAIPPVSGPMPQGGGLSSVFNRVKPW